MTGFISPTLIYTKPQTDGRANIIPALVFYLPILGVRKNVIILRDTRSHVIAIIGLFFNLISKDYVYDV